MRKPRHERAIPPRDLPVYLRVDRSGLVVCLSQSQPNVGGASTPTSSSKVHEDEFVDAETEFGEYGLCDPGGVGWQGFGGDGGRGCGCRGGGSKGSG